MRLITQRDRVRSRIARWREDFARGNQDPTLNARYERVRKALSQIDSETCGPAEVNAALEGPDFWPTITCDVCGLDVDMAIELQAREGLGAALEALEVCRWCIRDALAAFPPAERSK